MEGNSKSLSRKRPNPEYRRQGSAKKGNWQNSGSDRPSENSHSSETSYRIICSSRKIGSVIGKGGGIIKVLREETQAKITVADSVPGSDDRVILVVSPSAKLARKRNAERAGDDLDLKQECNTMEPHCAAQDALLKVHDRIIEEDTSGADKGGSNEVVVTARLLVPNNMVGCLLGRKGDVIQRLRGETGANIRILPADHLPSCALSTDELVQIAGKPAVAKKALYEVSTLLHQNPRKDNPPLSFLVACETQGLRPPGHPIVDMPPPRNLTWPRPDPENNDMPIPWSERYGHQPSRFGTGDFDNFPPAHGEDVASEFSIKILCSAAKIGGVIGKGGFNVRLLEQDTGAIIKAENVSPESDERVIRVSSFEVLQNPRSQTIDAILLLQNKTSECNEKGNITTRLLVPSSKVGCLLGQGGQVINEMRRRTMADIRVFSREDKPKCASDDEELVQISGSFAVVKHALTEVASRLRTRYLRDANAKGEPAPTRPITELFPSGNLSGGRLPPSASIGTSSFGRHELYKGRGREYEPPSYSILPSAMGYRGINNDVKMANNTIRSIAGVGGRSIDEIAAMRLKLQESLPGSHEHFADFRRSSEHLNSAQSMFQGIGSSVEQNSRHRWDPYHGYNSQRGVYQDTSPLGSPFQNLNHHQAPYEHVNRRQVPYESAQDPYRY